MPPSPQAVDFLKRCTLRYGTASNAIRELRKLGGPPQPSISLGFDVSHPTAKVLQSIELFGAIAMNTGGGARGGHTSALIKENWSTVLNHWIKFFLEDILLSSFEPTTPEGVDVVDHLLLIIPSILLFTDSHPRGAIMNMLTTPPKPSLQHILEYAPYLISAVSQVWYSVIAKSHPSWIHWSPILIDFAFVQKNTSHTLPEYRPPRPFSPASEDITPMFIRHIKTLTQSLPTMPSKDLLEFYNLLSGVHFTHNQTQNPLNDTRYAKDMLPLPIEIITTLVLKRKVQPEQGTHYFKPHSLVIMATEWLYNILARDYTPENVVRVLESGVMEVFFGAEDYFYRTDDPASKQSETHRLQYWVSRLFWFINRAMVFPAVFKSFQSVARLLEGEMMVKSEGVLQAWKEAAAKCSTMMEIRKELKARGLVMCSNKECPSRMSRGSRSDHDVIHYGACSGCKDAWYCSRRCQKITWKVHREICSRNTKESPFQFADYDRLFFKEFIHEYISDHLPEIRTRILDFVESSSKADLHSNDLQCIAQGLKYPVILLAFNVYGPFSFEACCHILEPSELHQSTTIRQGLEKEFVDEVTEEWRYGPASEYGSVQVLGMFLAVPSDPEGKKTKLLVPKRAVEMKFAIDSLFWEEDSD